MQFTIDKLRKQLKFLVNAYKMEANNETDNKADNKANNNNEKANTANNNKNNNTNINATNQPNTNTKTNNSLDDFNLNDLDQSSNIDNLTDFDNTNLQDANIGNDTNEKLTEDDVKEQINLFLLLKKLRDIVFMYLRLKNLVFNQPSFLSQLDADYINQFYELELVLEYLLINFKKIDQDTLNKYITKIEEQLNKLAMDIYSNTN
jgi:hypothetical protein